MFDLLAAVALACPATIEHRWHDDFDVALAEARESGRDLLVDFTGSDWCHWCIRLDEEVFQHDAFFDAASEEFVLVALDYPNGAAARAAVPNPKRNAELRDKYGVLGYPTVLMVDVDGAVFGRMGYQEGGPQAYVSTLRSLARSGRKMLARAKQLAGQYESSTDDQHVAIMESAVAFLQDSLASPNRIGWELVAPIARAAVELKGEDQQDLVSRAVSVLLEGAPDQELLDKVYRMDATNSQGLYERALRAELLLVQQEPAARALQVRLLEFSETMEPVDSKLVAELYGFVAIWNEKNFADHGMAVRFAKRALNLDPMINADIKAVLHKIVGPELQQPVPGK